VSAIAFATSRASKKAPPEPNLPDSQLCRPSFFEAAPHLVELDLHRPAFWLGLVRVGGRELLQTAWIVGVETPSNLAVRFIDKPLT